MIPQASDRVAGEQRSQEGRLDSLTQVGTVAASYDSGMSTKPIRPAFPIGLAVGLIAVGLLGVLLVASGRVAPSPRGSGVGAVPTGTPILASIAPEATPSSSVGSSPPAASRHVWWIWMENREYRSIIGSDDAPYINGLAMQYGLATRYYGIRHPSEPNYIAAVAGSTLGVTDDGRYDLDASSLFDQLEAAGRSWHVYAQDVPDGCFTGSAYRGGRDGPGRAGSYVRKHNPAISFRAISGDPARCGHISNLASFEPGSADFELIIPNLTNDMHDGSTADGDRFLRELVPLITASAAFQNGVVFITWDEGTTDLRGGGHIVTLVLRPGIEAGFRSATGHDHYDLLRTVEDVFGLDCLRNACDGRALSEFLQ